MKEKCSVCGEVFHKKGRWTTWINANKYRGGEFIGCDVYGEEEYFLCEKCMEEMMKWMGWSIGPCGRCKRTTQSDVHVICRFGIGRLCEKCYEEYKEKVRGRERWEED